MASVLETRDEANRRILGGKGSANKSAAHVAKLLGKTEEWVKSEQEKLKAEIKAQSGKAQTLTQAAVVKQRVPFDDSSENLERIANHVVVPRGPGENRTPTGPRKPSVFRERTEYQEPANEYARSKGLFVAVMDRDGFPDNLYLIPGNPIPFGVEWKAEGEEPSPKQAQRVLKLREWWDVRVLDNLETFETLVDTFISQQKVVA